jgi:phosphate transport system substrate-binding protein
VLAPLAALTLAGGLAACGTGNDSTAASGGASIDGAGSTFAAPIYQQWGNALKDRGVTVNYQPVGSGAGVAQWQSGTADFGATDPALTAEDRAGAKRGAGVQIPMAFGAITVAYNGAPKGLRLDGATVANIFLGRIKSWSDPAIVRLNPGVKLPGGAITVVHRSDESGTTKGFTGFLSDYSAEWKRRVGADKTVNWPTGTGAKGNDGVAAAIKQQPGAIGYVEQAYALQNDFTTATVRNKAGRFVAPTLASTTAAGEGITIPDDLGVDIVNSPNPQAYPIASQTFVVVYKDLCKAGLSKAKAQAFGKFVAYGLGDGQRVLGQLQYAKLSPALLSKSRSAAKSLKCNGSPVG